MWDSAVIFDPCSVCHEDMLICAGVTIFLLRAYPKQLLVLSEYDQSLLNRDEFHAKSGKLPFGFNPMTYLTGIKLKGSEVLRSAAHSFVTTILCAVL